MNKSVFKYQLWGFVFASAVGTFLHFLFDISGGALIFAPISGVNESTWEHMKLLFFPMLIYVFIENRLMRGEYPSFFCIKLRGILLGLLLIPILFYTIRGIFGDTPDFVNISIFFISAALAYFYEYSLFKKYDGEKRDCRIPLAAILFIAALFVVFTFRVPQIPLFEDPVTHTYGI